MSIKNRCFASMDRDRRREIASMGGKAAHVMGVAHQFTPEEAKAAGRKGGTAARDSGKAHMWTPAEASEAGRRSGEAKRRRGG